MPVTPLIRLHPRSPVVAVIPILAVLWTPKQFARRLRGRRERDGRDSRPDNRHRPLYRGRRGRPRQCRPRGRRGLQGIRLLRDHRARRAGTDDREPARGGGGFLRAPGRRETPRRAPGGSHQPRLEFAPGPLARLLARQGYPARPPGELRDGTGRGAGRALLHLRPGAGLLRAQYLAGRQTRFSRVHGGLLPGDGGPVAYGDADLRPRARPGGTATSTTASTAIPPASGRSAIPAGPTAPSRVSAGRASTTITGRSRSCGATTCRAGSRSSCATATGSTWSGRKAGLSAISATR